MPRCVNSIRLDEGWRRRNGGKRRPAGWQNEQRPGRGEQPDRGVVNPTSLNLDIEKRPNTE